MNVCNRDSIVRVKLLCVVISLAYKDKCYYLVFMCLLKVKGEKSEFRFHSDSDYVFIKGRRGLHFTTEVSDME